MRWNVWPRKKYCTVLSTAVDAGMENQKAANIVRAMGYAGAGLTATTALVFAADRSSRLYCKTTQNTDSLPTLWDS